MEDLFSLNGQTAIITGATRGLNYAIAEGLHNRGVKIVILNLGEEATAAASKKLQASGNTNTSVDYVIGDLSKLEDLPHLYKEALDKLGGHVDILVNGAGMQYRCEADKFPLVKWNQIIALNLSAVFKLSQLAAQTMLKQGYGKIINIASMTSFFGSEMIPAYAASKGGVMQLTKALSNEWAGQGINVNAIAPGYMKTALTADMKDKNPQQYAEITRRIPAHRWGEPSDLQGVSIFLASHASDYVSGAIIPVDGGYLGK